MNIDHIRRVALRAAHHAKVNGFEPKIPTGQLGVRVICNIPFLGDYVPPGWKFVRQYCVMTGTAPTIEAAITVDQFLDVVHANNQYGLGILKADDDQVYIGMYEKDDGRLALDTPERRDQEAYFGEGNEPEQEDDNG